MADVRETTLPGVGVRHEFVTEEGRTVGVLVHHDGRRDILIYGVDDPDTCTTTLALSANDSRTMDELLGGSRITEVNNVVQHEIEGLSIEWITVAPQSPAAGHSIGEGAYRTRTGASIVAVIRAEQPVPAPGPEFEFDADDVVVAVGTAEGLAALRVLLTEAGTTPNADSAPR
ncbi:MAG: cation:proton antiporter regulatory subunit [Actinomycetota bacterium]